MIEKPDLMIPEFANAGADLISVHAEACTHLHRTIQLIKSLESLRSKSSNNKDCDKNSDKECSNKDCDKSSDKECSNKDFDKNRNEHKEKKQEKSQKDKINIKAGVALNPATPLSAIEWVINDVDFVLVMSVNPGFGGQKFIESSVEKIKALSKMIKERNSKAIIQVDGGIGFETISKIASAGATSFVAGSAIFKTANYKETIMRLREQI
ncbi:MAG: ribulose-phosphate 3-epimerase [Desulfamplus sp.]|nr:ribulose-phosphate 3-epimerase [Desulfamplus sp.]